MGDATKACPSCAEQVQAAAKICRFCQYDFATGRAPAPPPPPVKSGGASMVIIIVIVVVLLGVCGVGVLAALLLPAVARATRNAKLTGCVNNLAQLWKMEHNYMVMFGGTAKAMPSETGGQFWLKLTMTTPPLVDVTLRDIYECPMDPDRYVAGTTDYRGPSGNVNTYADGDAVGADKETNHGRGEGGNVLRKSGDVLTVTESDPMWSAAGSQTSP